MGLLLFALEFVSLLLLGAGALLLTQGSLTAAGSPFATLSLFAAPVSCCALAFYYSDLYDLRRPFTIGQLTARIARALGLAALALTILYVLFPALRPEHSWLASLAGLLIIFAVVSFLLHWGARRILVPAEKVLIVGTTPLGIEVATHLVELNHATVGFVEHEKPADRARLPGPLLGTLRNAAAIIAETLPDRIVLAVHGYGDEALVRALFERRLGGFAVETAPQAYERLMGKVVLDDVTVDYLIISGAFRRASLHNALKRLMSVVVALVGLVLALPLMAVIALWIRMTSRGPIFFVQRRIGLHERPFWLIKFRTMNQDEAVRSEWEGDNEHRITRLGRWLRKLHLDELPQLWNILRGDMDLVGPRPHPVSNHQLFTRSIPFYHLRSLIRPGLTGWAQVRNGYANDLNGEIHKMKYDLYYIAHPSFLRDFHILLQTAKVVLFGVSANAPEPSRLREPSRRHEIVGPDTLSP
jgi:exopolysaccharide biosynthesis polyprenyl glycosylphosphotransferase